MGHDATVFAASMGGLEVDSQIGGASCFLNFSYYVVSQLFLKSSSSCAPLSNSGALAESDQFFCGNHSDIGDSDHGLMMMAAHAIKLAANHQHSIITAFAIIGKSCIIRSFLVPSNHKLFVVHLGDPFCRFLAIRIIFTVNKECIQKFFKSLSCLLGKFLSILRCDILRDVVASPKPFPLEPHLFSNGLRK